jgi:hypothetical protein
MIDAFTRLYRKSFGASFIRHHFPLHFIPPRKEVLTTNSYYKSVQEGVPEMFPGWVIVGHDNKGQIAIDTTMRNIFGEVSIFKWGIEPKSPPTFSQIYLIRRITRKRSTKIEITCYKNLICFGLLIHFQEYNLYSILYRKPEANREDAVSIK